MPAFDVGYESGSDEILKNIKKGVTVEQLREFTKNAKKAKLKILADFVIGFPGETKETAEQTAKFIREIEPDLLQVAVATPMPGTEFFKFCREKNHLLSLDLRDSIDNIGIQKCIVSYPHLTNVQIENFVHDTILNYYLNIRYLLIILKNIGTKHFFNESKIYIKSGKNFLKIIWGVQ